MSACTCHLSVFRIEHKPGPAHHADCPLYAPEGNSMGLITQPFAFSTPERHRLSAGDSRPDTLLNERVQQMEKAVDDAVKSLREDGWTGTADQMDDAWGDLRQSLRRESAR